MPGRRPTEESSNSPRDGDVVIAPVSVPGSAYEIRVEPGVPQILVGTKEQAVEEACRFARDAGVDVWYQDGVSATCVERYRSR